MTCKNCKYFKENDQYSGSCISDKFMIGYFSEFVDYGDTTRYPQKIIHPDGVMIEGDEGWGFFVGKDFGCIHFEKNDN